VPTRGQIGPTNVTSTLEERRLWTFSGADIRSFEVAGNP